MNREIGSARRLAAEGAAGTGPSVDPAASAPNECADELVGGDRHDPNSNVPRRTRRPARTSAHGRATDFPCPDAHGFDTSGIDDLRRAGVRAEALAIRDVPLTEIDDTDTSLQFRFSSESKELRESLEREGQLTPIIIAFSPTRDCYIIVDGFCRVAGAKLLRWRKIKALVYAYEDEAELRKVAFLMNVVRKNLSSTERANAMAKAARNDLSKKLIAASFGVTERTVERTLALPEHILAVVDGTVVTMAHGKVLTEFSKRSNGGLGADKVQELAEEVRQENLTAKELRARLRAGCSGRPRRFACVAADGRVRIYATNLGPASSPDELAAARDHLRDAVERLEEILERRVQDEKDSDGIR